MAEVRAVIAKSFARIHLAKQVNFGILPLVFVNGEDIDLFNQGDSLLIKTATLNSGSTYKLVNNTTVLVALVESPLSQEDLDYVMVGGRLN